MYDDMSSTPLFGAIIPHRLQLQSGNLCRHFIQIGSNSISTSLMEIDVSLPCIPAVVDTCIQLYTVENVSLVKSRNLSIAYS